MLKFICLLLLTLSCGAESVKIITYNVLYGFNHGKNIKDGQAWLKAQQADFIALQEMKGFDANKFAKLAKSWGHEHSYFYKRPQGMPLAFSSRFPISEVEELHTKAGVHASIGPGARVEEDEVSTATDPEID